VPYRKTEFRAGHYYHLYNRGVNRQRIFFCNDNWGYFVKRIRHYFRPDLVDIVAYCLMPTHYHLLVYLKTDDLSKQVMQPFSLSYTKAINRQQERVGPLCGDLSGARCRPVTVRLASGVSRVRGVVSRSGRRNHRAPAA
jgi:putative transposase